MRWVPDRTGRFAQRPHWSPGELDAECDSIVSAFRRSTGRGLGYPLSTDDLTVLVESEVAELDLYADLTAEGDDVEGMTDFFINAKPRVRISARLTDDGRRVNRLRTTLTHELGHVRLHGFLAGLEATLPMFEAAPKRFTACRRGTVLDAPAVDWLEWQAAYASGSILMPRGPVAELVGAILERRGVFGPVAEDTADATEVVDTVVAGFGVSREAASVRLRKLNHLAEAGLGGPTIF